VEASASASTSDAELAHALEAQQATHLAALAQRDAEHSAEQDEMLASYEAVTSELLGGDRWGGCAGATGV